MSAFHLLSTFPGWPTVQDPSFFFLFMLCLGGPLLVGLVIVGLFVGRGHEKTYDEEQRAAGLAAGGEQLAVGARRVAPKHALEDEATVTGRTGSHAAH